jgi:hypothetical protein
VGNRTSKEAAEIPMQLERSMPVPDPAIDLAALKLISVEDYEPLIGAKAVDRIQSKARRLHDLHLLNINSTYYGGGVAEILSSLTLLMNAAGIKTGWRVIQGRPDFFSITKKMHNALHGAEINITDLKTQIYEEVAFENAVRMHLDHDVVIVHDPQPLPLIQHFRKVAPWIWRCHVESGAMELFVASHRAVRCCRFVIARVRPKADDAAAFHCTGDQSLLDDQQRAVR